MCIRNSKNGGVAGKRPSPDFFQGERSLGRLEAYPTFGAVGRRMRGFLSDSFLPLAVVGADMVGSGAPLRGSPGVMAARRAVDWVT